MFSEVRIDAKSASETVLVDKQAVIQTAKQNRVLIMSDDGKFSTRPVLIGDSDWQYRQILSGLQAGDKVVTSGLFLIDSEANKNAAISRLDAAENAVDQATVKGVIKTVDRQQRQVSVYREAIEKWQRPAALVTFNLADSVNISLLEESAEIEFIFSIIDREFVITSLLAVQQGGEQ
jgi:Cu(I)/Ag(I) efflux system membrane fusion protein